VICALDIILISLPEFFDDTKLMQSSHYNIFTPCNFKEGSDILFNPATGAFILIPSADARAIEANDFYKIEPEMLEKYRERGLIVDDDGSLERSRLKFYHWKNKMSADSLSLTLIPTYLCNFACSYCYESVLKGLNDDASRMSGAVCDSIVKLVENKIREGAKSISFEWYGGEPLLAKDIVESLSLRLIRLCKEKGVPYRNTIVTNGYLLDEETAKMLADIEISNAQITIDGTSEVHNKTRKLRNGEDTFDRIVENIKTACKYLKKIVVRVNISADNLGAAADVREYFREAIPDAANISVYPTIVINTDYTYGADENEFQRHKDKFYRGDTWPERMERRTGTHCMLNRASSFIIDCHGRVLKCGVFLGEDYVVGTLAKNGDIQYNQKYYDYVLYDPTEDPECKNCKHLPVCMGGCRPYRWKNLTCEHKLVTAEEINRKLNCEAVQRIFF